MMCAGEGEGRGTDMQLIWFGELGNAGCSAMLQNMGADTCTGNKPTCDKTAEPSSLVNTQTKVAERSKPCKA